MSSWEEKDADDERRDLLC